MKTLLLFPLASKVAFRIATTVAGIMAMLIIRTIGIESKNVGKNLSITAGRAMMAIMAAAMDIRRPSCLIVLLFFPQDSSGNR